jgi:hypothetical protein
MLRRPRARSPHIAPNTICRRTTAKRGRIDHARPFFSFFVCQISTRKHTACRPASASLSSAGGPAWGRTTVSQALSRGDLEHYRVGSRVVIPEPAVLSWLESHRISKRPKLRVA